MLSVGGQRTTTVVVVVQSVVRDANFALTAQSTAVVVEVVTMVVVSIVADGIFESTMSPYPSR